mgnify:FL=1
MKAKEIHFTKKKEQLRKRIIRIANYMIQNQQGLTKTAMRFKTTKEQIEQYVTADFIPFVLADPSLENLYIGVKEVIRKHADEDFELPEKILLRMRRDMEKGKKTEQLLQELPEYFKDEHLKLSNPITLETLEKQLATANIEPETKETLLETPIPEETLIFMLMDYSTHGSFYQLEQDYGRSKEAFLRELSQKLPEQIPLIQEIEKQHTENRPRK